MTETAPPGGAEAPVGLRMQLAVYAAATFSNSLGYMVTVAVPLWVVTLEPSALMVGLVLGARHLLVLVYSIHGGAMMDRFGARRVMILFASAGVVIPLLYPLLPHIWALIVLQMLAGFAGAAGWMGAQTYIGQAMKANPLYAGRMSAVIRIGVLTGPPLTGAAWDVAGPWGAFAVLALWGVGVLAACYALPAPAGAESGPPPRFRLGDFAPRLADYAAAFSLMAVPVIAVVMLVSVLRISSFGIQSSFYVVWLEGAGYTGTAIGVLMAVFGAFGGAGALLIGPALRRSSGVWLMFATVAATTLAISVTPLLGSFALLFLAAAAYGTAYGLSQPLMIILASRGAGGGAQGKVVGLRTTANRLAGTFLPVIMGGVAEVWGLEASFYIVGGAILVLLAAGGIYARAAGAARPAP